MHRFLNKFAAKWYKCFPPHLNNVSMLPGETWNAHRTRATIGLLQEETPEKYLGLCFTMQTPYCYYGCSIPPFFLSFFLSHFPSKSVPLLLHENKHCRPETLIQCAEWSWFQHPAFFGNLPLHKKKLIALQNYSLMPRMAETSSNLHANAEMTSPYRQTRVTLTHCSMAGSCIMAIMQPHAMLQVHTDRQG